MKLLVGIECLPALYFLLTYSGSQLYTPKAIGQQYCLDKTDLTPQPPSLVGKGELDSLSRELPRARYYGAPT
jgi:hypothetical protein